MQNTIKLVPYADIHYKDLLSYELDEEQNQFTALPKENLVTRDILADPAKTPVTILLGNKAIGFFVFDSGPDKNQLTDNAAALLLRSLSINPAFQGRGFGSQAMSVCQQYVQQYLPACNEIVLSVNQQNTAAYGMYLKSGFKDTGKMITSRSGPQHAMTKAVYTAEAGHLKS